VAFDGSPRAEDALALAQRLLDPGAGTLTLACVVPRGHADDAALEQVALLLAGARARVPTGVRVRLRAPEAASPARGLIELAEEERADLVVVGSSRRGGGGQISLERTAGRLLQGAPCAVAVAPADLRTTEPFRHVGIAYDGSPEADVALAAGYRLVGALGSAVTLYMVVTPSADPLHARLEAQTQLDAAADAAPTGVNPRTELLRGLPGPQIAAACDGIVDLLVTGSRGYGPLGRVLLGSVSTQLAHKAPCPVLVVPRP
jgi:nucleotide-binding universal stress UspA family protein